MAEGNQLMRAGGAVHGIVPQSFEEAWRVAGAMAASGLTPKDINTQEKVLVVIMAGAEIGMPPFQALQSFAVINGRPALWGDGMLGVARKFGTKVDEWLTGADDALTAHCKVTRADTGEVIERSFSITDAKKAGLWGKAGPWTQYPKRMLQMRARAWALRDGCADMLRGMKMAEEVQDYAEVESVEDVPQITMGEAKDRLVDDWNARMRAATSVQDIDDIEAEAVSYRPPVSRNVLDGIAAVAEDERERVNAGGAPREREPSPFEGFKADLLSLASMEDREAARAAHRSWQRVALSRTKLALCSVEERKELQRLDRVTAKELKPVEA